MTHLTKERIDAALDEMIDGRAGVGDWFLNHKDTILAALKLAEKFIAYKENTLYVPIGHEQKERGCSTYNWRRHILQQIESGEK